MLTGLSHCKLQHFISDITVLGPFSRKGSLPGQVEIRVAVLRSWGITLRLGISAQCCVLASV